MMVGNSISETGWMGSASRDWRDDGRKVWRRGEEKRRRSRRVRKWERDYAVGVGFGNDGKQSIWLVVEG